MSPFILISCWLALRGAASMTDSTMSFEDALRESEELLCDFEEHGDKEELLLKLDAILSSVASCRGFFVCFLTGDSMLAEQPPAFLLEALQKSEQVPELLAKNLVMSTTMKITHERTGSLINAEASEMVARRTKQLIRLLKSDQIRSKLIEMRSSIRMKAGVFADFLRRWNYDDEQLAAASTAIEESLS